MALSPVSRGGSVSSFVNVTRLTLPSAASRPTPNRSGATGPSGLLASLRGTPSTLPRQLGLPLGVSQSTAFSGLTVFPSLATQPRVFLRTEVEFPRTLLCLCGDPAGCDRANLPGSLRAPVGLGGGARLALGGEGAPGTRPQLALPSPAAPAAPAFLRASLGPGSVCSAAVTAP